MSVAHVRTHYASMADRIAQARRGFGRPLTLTEKILASHCWDFDTQVWERGKAILRLRVDRVALQDVTGQMALFQFMMSGRKRVDLTVSLFDTLAASRRKQVESEAAEVARAREVPEATVTFE